MKLQILILLTTTLAISCGQCEEIEVFVESGSTAVLPCDVYSPDAHSFAVLWKRQLGNEVKTVWRRDRNGLEYRSMGKASRTYCLQPNFGRGQFSLRIEGVTDEDGGIYYCVVEGKKEHIKKVILRVVQVSFSSTEVLEGDSLTVTCNITPQSYNVRTMLELNGLKRSTWAQTQTLRLSNISQKESGSWRCLIQNSEVSASASLQVKGILVPKYNYEIVYAEVGSFVTLPCIFSDGLIANSMFWKKEPTTSGLQDSVPTSLKNSSGLHIKSVEENDKGIYKCSGQMEAAWWKRGKVERVIQLVTARVLSSYKRDQLTLTCELSHIRGVTDYEWLHLDYGENNTQKMSTVQTSPSKVLKIPKGEEKRHGGWMCRFYEQKRLLGNATYNQLIMSGLAGQKESGSSRKVITVIGLSLLLLLVVLIVLQMYKNHRRRKMIMQYPAMETIVHLASNERERQERSKQREKESKASCSADLKSVSVIE